MHNGKVFPREVVLNGTSRRGLVDYISIVIKPGVICILFINYKLLLYKSDVKLVIKPSFGHYYLTKISLPSQEYGSCFLLVRFWVWYFQIKHLNHKLTHSRSYRIAYFTPASSTCLEQMYTLLIILGVSRNRPMLPFNCL